ncbi:MAG: ribonuclease III [Ruminococcaceae bacterium]|nr:ribonuclease III [Oscillospiraceae bacterium]
MYYDEKKVKLMNPAVLSFVGDAVFTLLVRERLADVNRPSGQLHSLSVGFVCAGGQVKAFELIKDMLSEEETEIFKRGRNFHTGRTPKNASGKDYHTATGIETLFGYLYLSSKTDRLNELFLPIWQNFSDSIKEDL